MSFRVSDLVAAGIIQGSSAYANIFYDSANTSYYADPAGTSVFNGLTVGGNAVLTTGNYNSYAPTLTGGGASGTWGINITGSSNSSQSSNVAYQLQAGDAVQNYGARFMTNDYSTMTFMSRAWQDVQGPNGLAYNFTTHTNGGSGGYGALQIYYGESGHVFAPTSFRAPIFYDSQNTAYYLDPSNFSNLYSATFNSTVNFSSNTNWFGGYGPGSGPGLAFENQGSFIRLAFWGMDFYDWDNGIQMTLNNGYVSVNNYLQAGNSLRAPIFYDSNDTSYYLDPNGSSTLYSVTTNGRIYSNEWIQFSNYTGLYSPNNGAHFRPNSGSYGPWLVSGSRNGWSGIEFESLSNGNISMMISTNSNVVGWHNNSYGWQFRWEGGTAYVYKNSYGGGTQATVWDSANAPRANYSNLMYYQGFTLDANTMETNSTGFTYSVNAPFTGPIARFSTGGSYDMWLGGNYGGSGNDFYIRTRNGDSGSINPWRLLITDGNYTSYSPTLTGGGASGTWGINVTGTAGSETLATVTGRGATTSTAIQVNNKIGTSDNQGIFLRGTGDSAHKLYYNSSIPANIWEYNANILFQHFNGGSPVTRFTFDTAGNGVATSSFRAPIFYDSNDTTYYADFADSGRSMYTAGYLQSSGMIMKGSIFAGSGGGQIYPTMSNGGVSLYGGNNLTNGAYFTVTGIGYSASPGAGSAEFVIRSEASSKFAMFSYNGSTYTGRYSLWGSTGNVTIGSATTDYGYRFAVEGDAYVTNVLKVGTTNSPAYMLVVGGTAFGGSIYAYGDIYATGSITAYSDSSVKTNIRPIDNVLERVSKSRGVVYDRSDIASNNNIGFIAQELEEQFPELVSTGIDGKKGVKYQNMVAVLVEAVKEQQKQIDKLQSLINK